MVWPHTCSVCFISIKLDRELVVLCLPPPSFLHTSSGGKGPLWLHIRSGSAGLCQHVCSVEPDEYERCVCCVCDERTGLLPPSNGPPLGSLAGIVTSVSNSHACMHTRTHTHARTHAHTHMHAHTHAHLHARTHTRTHARTHTCMHAHTHTHTHASTSPSLLQRYFRPHPCPHYHCVVQLRSIQAVCHCSCHARPAADSGLPLCSGVWSVCTSDNILTPFLFHVTLTDASNK